MRLNNMANSLNWFAIPSRDFKRAVKFYNSLFDNGMQVMQMNGEDLAFFPCGQGEVGGHLFQDDAFAPSENGTTLYLNGGDDLQPMLDKVEAAGGKVLSPKTQVTPEIGYIAMFLDTEGNKVAFHSPN